MSTSICSTMQIHSQIYILFIKSINKLCWLCDNKGIYQCPACDTVSCSLKCCLKHKEIAECTGDWRDADVDYSNPHQLYRDLNQLIQIENTNKELVLSANSITTPNKKICSISVQQEGYLDILTQQQLLPKHIKNLQKQLQKIYHTKLLLSKNIMKTDTIYTYFSNYDYKDNKFTLQCKLYVIDYKKQIYDNATIYLQRYLEFLDKKQIYNIKAYKQQPFDIVFTIFMGTANTFFIQDDQIIADKIRENQTIDEKDDVLLKLDLTANNYYLIPSAQKLSELLQHRLVIVDYLKVLIVKNKLQINEEFVLSHANKLMEKFETTQIQYIWKKIVNYLNIKYTAQIKNLNSVSEHWKQYIDDKQIATKKVML